MGNKHSNSVDESLAEIHTRLHSRVGMIPITGRYHKKPKVISDDYDVSSKVLGTGFNGVVREATRKVAGSKERFAVKAFQLANVASDKKLQLVAEVEIFLSLDHPHVARLADVYEEVDHLYLVMECMDGGELFDRVQEVKRFTEKDAADAVWQMLLALNYLHLHDIVHRDLKLENFLYDKKGSNHLKLIDFGFSKIWDPNIKMHMSCGTLSYVAPEVLQKSYTSQCDVWSLGVIAFIILSGSMPFYGDEVVQSKKIGRGQYEMKPAKWAGVSELAKEFVNSLLQVDPNVRPTAKIALEHKWIEQRHRQNVDNIDDSVANALRSFGQASKFRRCCLEMMAWSLSNDERAKVRDIFISMDVNKTGTITLSELRHVLTKRFNINDSEILDIFTALDTNHDEEIHYSDFLAAMLSTRIALHDELLRSTFKKFDVDSSQYITVENLREVLGETFDGETVDQLILEGDLEGDGRISYPEFVKYLRSAPAASHMEAADKVIGQKLRETKEVPTFLKGVKKLQCKENSLDNFAPGEQRRAPPLCCVIT